MRKLVLSEEKDPDAPASGEALAAPPTGLGEARLGRYSGGMVVAGKYQLETILGEGGMGSVWVAKNRTLDVEVAVKLMRAELAENVDGIAERMLQEARAAASIGHPAIIQVFDFGLTELGDPFIVMELLRGESLAQAILRRGRVHPVRAVQTLLPIVDALAAAHQCKIVHRDLKPENIFLAHPAGQRLQPKVLDFGIAKLEQRAAERLTRDGAVIGSPAYMAPEQLQGDPEVDGRADIWALGVVLYQMVTGARPFDGGSYHASLWNVAHGEPRALAEHGVDAPELWNVIQGCLVKDPKGRYSEMRSLGQALARWLVAQGVHEDVGNASLATWLEEGALSNPQVHSFFPSGAPQPLVQVETGSGERRIALEAPSSTIKAQRLKVASPKLTTRYLVLVAVAALTAFLGAGVWTGIREEPESASESVGRKSALRTEADWAPPRERKIEPGQPRGVLSPFAGALVPPVDARAEPESPARPAKRVSSPKTSSRADAAKSELKNPFQ